MQLDKKFVANLFDVDEAEITSIDGLKVDLAGEDLSLERLLLKRHEKKMQALGTDLQSEDDLGKVIRGHIHIEHELNQIIFFAAANPNELKSFDRQEFSEKVRLALVLGLKTDLATPLNAAGNLRNKFAHRLDTKLSKQMAKTLIATLPPVLKARFDALLSTARSELPKLIARLPALKARFEVLLGHSLSDSELADPFGLLKGERRTYADAQMDVIAFFLCLFGEVANERVRFAVQKIERMKATAAQTQIP